MALPPSIKILTPAKVASGWLETTMPFLAMTENFSAMISFRDPLSFRQQQKFHQQAAQKDVKCEVDPRAGIRENVIENSEPSTN
jgi:hypothetical protein